MVMDQQAAMERLQELYREKNEHLEKFLEPVTPFEFYREIFPVGSFERKGHFEDAKGNGIAVTVPPKAAGIALEIKEEGKAKRYTITDELSELSEVYDTDFTIMRRYSEMPLKILKAEELVGGEAAMDELLHGLFNRELDPMYPYLTYQEFLDACGLTEEDLTLD